MDGFISIGNEIMTAFKILGGTVAAICLGIGAYLHMTGGAEGLQKAKNWYKGVVIGLIVLFGATSIVTWLQGKMTF